MKLEIKKAKCNNRKQQSASKKKKTYWKSGLRQSLHKSRMCAQRLSPVWLSVTPGTVTHRAPLSLGFSRRAYRSRLPFPPPGALPDAGAEPSIPESPVRAGGLFTTESPGKPLEQIRSSFNISFTDSEMYTFRRHFILSSTVQNILIGNDALFNCMRVPKLTPFHSTLSLHTTCLRSSATVGDRVNTLNVK